MRLNLGSRSHDLTSRALVIGVGPDAGAPAGHGADLVELTDAPASTGVGVPTAAVVGHPAELDFALGSGAVLVRLLRPSAADLARCAAAGVAVVVPAARMADAAAAGLAEAKVASAELFVDLVDSDDPLAAAVAGVIRGARLIRTGDVRAVRRVCDVLAAVMEARR